MSDFGPPAVPLHPSMRFKPVRLLIGLLFPPNKRCFVTPLQQSWHHSPVWSQPPQFEAKRNVSSTAASNPIRATHSIA